MTRSRRDVLRAAGVLAASAATAGTASASGGWHAVESPTDRSLRDVTHAGRAYAVGDDGVVLERRDGGWRPVTTEGPDGNGSNLHALAAGPDGERVWVAGASGALAELDVATNEFASHRAPDDVTNEFSDVAVRGDVVYVADTSGHVHVGTDGGRTWTHETPGSGASIRALSRTANGVACVDGNGAVFERADGTWTREGIEDADHALRAVAHAGGQLRVAGGALYLETAAGWDVTNPSEATLTDLEVSSCGCVHAVGDDGTVVHRPGRGIPMGTTVARWLGVWDVTRPVGDDLNAVAVGRPHVAVGASGTILER